MTLRERLARALSAAAERRGGPPWDWYRTARQREHFFEDVDAMLAVLAEDPGHDITEGTVAVGANRTDALRIWTGMIANIAAETDRRDEAEQQDSCKTPQGEQHDAPSF